MCLLFRILYCNLNSVIMKNSFLKDSLIERERFVDVETGEILEENTKHHAYLANTKEEFMLLYSSMIGIFEGFTQAECRVYGYLLRYTDGLSFDISKKLRMDMADHTKLNERTIYNTCMQLMKKHLIFKDKNGLYRINPRFAFRGSSMERNRRLKTILELECPDC